MTEAMTPEVVEEPSALVAQQNAGIVHAAPGDVTDAFQQYKQIQSALDRAMPDCIMQIQGKPFRKKKYWRAIGTAFNLQLELRHEERVEVDGDWGYAVSYRATAPNGRFADGDGTCMKSEKSGSMGTLHNVRAHAHTRAKNRAISDLVGFGEVSAEEMQSEERAAPRGVQAAISRRESAPPPRSTASLPPPPKSGRLATEAQTRMLWAKAMAKAEQLGVTRDDAEARLRKIVGDLGYESSRDMHASCVDRVVNIINEWTLETFGEAPPPADMDSPF